MTSKIEITPNMADNKPISSQLLASYVGPLPPAQQFAAYDQTLPGAANRMMVQSEKEQENRFLNDQRTHEYNLLMIKNSHYQNMTGTIIGGLMSFIIIISGAILIYKNHDWAGGSIITTTLVGLAGVFVYGTMKKE